MNLQVEPLSDGLMIRFPASLTMVDLACASVGDKMRNWGLKNLWFPVHLILREVLNNGVIHGCHEDKDLEVGVEIRKEEPYLKIRVWDEGPGFDWKEVLARPEDPDQDNGRGFPILSNYTDHFDFNSQGNEITIKIEIPEQEMKIVDIQEIEGWTVVRPQQDVVSTVAADLRKELKNLVDSGKKKIEIDLLKVGIMDSMGLGLLIALHNSLKDKGGNIRVVNLSPELMELFKNMRLDRHFEVTAG